MNNINDQWWYEVNGQRFDNKLIAIKNSNEKTQPVHFHCPKNYYTQDFSKKPTDTLDVLLKQQAQKIRDTYKTVRLYFSGGSDSYLVLKTFIDNKIPIDEIICLKSGLGESDFEITDYAIPLLHKHKESLRQTKITISEPSIKDYYDYYHTGVTDKKIEIGYFTYHSYLRLHQQHEIWNEKNINSETANIRGFDKPKVIKVDEDWYTYFVDVEIEPMGHMINFFSVDPNIQSKQAHMLLEKIHTINYEKDTDIWNNQKFWNESIGRNFTNDLPLKNIFLGAENNFVNHKNNKFYYYNTKEKFALEHVKSRSSDILDMYAHSLDELNQFTTNTWWNNSKPELGTIGIFSEFFCLTKKSVKTVDELYPDGFKSQWNSGF